MNVLVTGGTGFVGRCLVQRLLKNGDAVFILTRHRNKIENSLMGKVTVLKGDLLDSNALDNSDIKDKQIDAVFHLAACLDYFGNKRKLYKANVAGTMNILEFSKRNRIKKFIFTSSIEAMGTFRNREVPADEDSIKDPVSSYGFSKLAAEKMIHEFQGEGNKDIQVLRLAQVYGPGGLSFVVRIANAILGRTALLRFLHRYKDIYIHPVYIDDVVEGTIKAAWNVGSGSTYILAGPEYCSIGDIFKIVAQTLNVDINAKCLEENRIDDFYLNVRTRLHRFLKKSDLMTYFLSGRHPSCHRAYSTEKARREIGYFPKVDVKEGIEKTIRWALAQELIRK